jgi:hypothetical protein
MMPKTQKRTSSESSPPVEMRRELRYRLDVPVLFSWQNALNRRLYAEGISRDISVLGAYIVTATCPPLETHVEVEVALPSLAGNNSVVRIKGEARVIRVEHRSGDVGKYGFAVVREASHQWTLALDREEIEGIPYGHLDMREKSVIQ